jgi:hypothetical protein
MLFDIYLKTRVVPVHFFLHTKQRCVNLEGIRGN